jgi:hypothetical protein
MNIERQGMAQFCRDLEERNENLCLSQRISRSQLIDQTRAFEKIRKIAINAK